MNESPKVKIMITGHTDNVGNDEANMTLSLNRAKSVAVALEKSGIDPSRIKYEGRVRPYRETQMIPLQVAKTIGEQNLL